MIDAAAAKYHVDPNFLARVLWQENRFRPEGTSTAGAQGIAQFMPATAARYGVDVHNPASSIEGAAHYLSDLSDRYSGNLGLIAAGYNWGERNVDKWLQDKSKPPSETTNYVNTITGHSMDEWRADPRLPLGSSGPGRSPSGPAVGTTLNNTGGGLGGAIAGLAAGTGASGTGPSAIQDLEKSISGDAKQQDSTSSAYAAQYQGQLQQAAAAQGMMRQQQIAAQAAQMAALNQQRAMQPLTWGSAPWSGGAGQQAMAPPGTTLNTTGAA